MNLDSYDDYVSLLFELLNPLKPFYSKECARVRFNGPGALYDQNAIEMEAFARPLWGLSALWKGGYRNDDFHSLYCKGIINGTDPSSPEYWGNPSDNDQRFVEMVPLQLHFFLLLIYFGIRYQWKKKKVLQRILEQSMSMNFQNVTGSSSAFLSIQR